MSAPDYEAIWAALFALLKSKLQAEYSTMSRKHSAPPELTPELQPALFCWAIRKHDKPTPRGTGGTVQLSGFIFIYDRQPDSGEAAGQETILGETKILNHLKNLDQALAPADNDPYNRVQTLGGLVSHVWIDGATDMDPGILGPQCMAIVPIHILVP